MQLDERNRLERTRLDRGLFAWSYAFPAPSPAVPLLAIGIEIGIVLHGERSFAFADGGRATYGAGEISIMDLGEGYTTHFAPPPLGRGREIGFVLRVDREQEWLDRGAVPTFPRRSRIADLRLVEVAHDVARAFDARGRAPAVEAAFASLASEVRAFVRRHAVLAPVDALVRARLELHRHFAKPLYMRHFAEVAGVHSATFARKFAARYGVTPTRYRTLLRLQEAAVLLATSSNLTVGEVAARVGFEDVPYFHRAFAARVGATPLALARRFSAGSPISERRLPRPIELPIELPSSPSL